MAMKHTLRNPYLPPDVYIPDTEPHVFGDRLYIYGSHDKENGEVYCMLDYECWSAPVDDLSDWRCEGTIYRAAQDPHYREGTCLWAPDVCRGPDGRYYLYYILSTEFEIAVAVAFHPAGPYTYLGRVRHADGSVLEENVPFDPAVICEEGHVYLYYGFAPTFPVPRLNGRKTPGASAVELCDDMLTVKTGPQVVIPAAADAAGSSFEGHAFFEACSIRHVEGTWVLIYCSEHAHELCYATSTQPMGDFRFRGVLISNADLGYEGNAVPKNSYANIHGGLARVRGQWYLFYHRHTHGHQCSRQGCAESVFPAEGFEIRQVSMTSTGLNPAPLAAGETISGVYACRLYPPEGGRALRYGETFADIPRITNEGEIRFIAGLTPGSRAVFAPFQAKEACILQIRARGSSGRLVAETEEGMPIGSVEIQASPGFRLFEGTAFFPEEPVSLTFRYEGEGAADLLEFRVLTALQSPPDGSPAAPAPSQTSGCRC